MLTYCARRRHWKEAAAGRAASGMRGGEAMESRYNKPEQPYSPSISEIRRICRTIRATWSRGERRKRAGAFGYAPWLPPRVHVDEEDASTWSDGF